MVGEETKPLASVVYLAQNRVATIQSCAVMDSIRGGMLPHHHLLVILVVINSRDSGIATRPDLVPREESYIFLGDFVCTEPAIMDSLITACARLLILYHAWQICIHACDMR